MMEAVVLNGITKTYNKGKTVALDDIALEVQQGELFGLIGPDGAGKTTLFRIIATLLLPDKGTATVDGLDSGDYRAIRNRLGYMPGKFSLYPDLTVAENLNFFATLFHTTVAENYDLIKDIYDQIAPFKDRSAGKLSGGMKQKLALCCALVHQPKILLLDEPTTGVDPVSRKEFWEMLKRLKERNITILVSTPYMDEAVLCDRIALIDKARILSTNTPSAVIQAYPDDLFAVKAKNMSLLLKAIAHNDQKTSGYAFGEYAHISFPKTTMTTEELNRYFSAQGMEAVSLHKAEATIEDSFIKMMQYGSADSH